MTAVTPATALLSLSPQNDLLAPFENGLFNGCAYGLLALGIVLLYKSNRILNFAQGEFAGVALVVSYCFDTGYKTKFGFSFPHTPYVIAIVIGVASAVLAAVLTQLIVVRPLFNQPRVVLVVATVGVSLALIGVEGLLFPSVGNFRQVTAALNITQPAFKTGQLPVQWFDLLRLAVLVGLAVSALLFFKRTATGTAVLAVSQDPTAASVVGIQVQKVSLITWALAGLLGGMAGVLPTAIVGQSLVPGVFTGIVLTASFTAAVLGGITSLPGAFIGGLLLGEVQAFANVHAKSIPGLDQLPGSQDEFVVFLLLLAVLIFRPAGLLGKEI